MAKLAGKVGFASPISEETLSRRQTTKIELIATLVLAVSLVIAVTAVSIGVAHAQTISAVSDSDGASSAIAVFLGAVTILMGGLTVMAARGPKADLTKLGPHSDRLTRL